MLQRSHDVAFINKIVNDPDVRPYVGAPELGELDLSALVNAPEHWFLMGEHGGFGLIWTSPKTYEVHTFVLSSGRGKWAEEARAEGIEYAKQHGAKTLWTRVPPNMPHVKRFARQGGMRSTHEVIESFGTSYDVYAMELM